MKFFAFIMAVLVLVLSCMPCTDEAVAMNGAKATKEFSKTHSHPQENSEDDCSPFCSCNCCAGFTLIHAAHPVVGFIFTVPEKNAVLLPQQLSAISLPVWQPPQLV